MADSSWNSFRASTQIVRRARVEARFSFLTPYQQTSKSFRSADCASRHCRPSRESVPLSGIRQELRQEDAVRKQSRQVADALINC
jgi:hypothetical protein